MKKEEMKKVIEESSYSTLYLPIANIETNEVFAYEALSRFKIKDEIVSSGEFFNKLHKNDKIFFYLERRNKKLQIEGLKDNKKLILHFDTTVFKEKEYRSFWKEFLSQYRENIIIEISHSSIITNDEMKRESKFIKWLAKNNFDFMITLFNDELNNLSFKNLEKAKYVKINKKLIQEGIKKNSYIGLLKSFVIFCRENNIKTIVPHIDFQSELKVARDIGVDYVQGSIIK